MILLNPAAYEYGDVPLGTTLFYFDRTRFSGFDDHSCRKDRIP